ncbi:MAG: hypothetical protein KDD02_05025 [Phaeodactylibacter sp.]|nr:hypothetical protein [Phaeodactylibacter sp.]MCB9304425.1 hypothetical protein [Lewinellaceae bacterium]HQU61043.1 hypothetical protein [Saprospiraceae bacterium]
MEYRIRVKGGKERAFLQILHALQSLGVVESIELTGRPDQGHISERQIKADELASQYRDLVD